MDYIKINPTDTPWEIACQLINLTTEVNSLLSPTLITVKVFEVEELRKIGEHLLNYCNVEGGDDK